MKRNGWVVMLLLVPLLAQATAVALPGSCAMPGPADKLQAMQQGTVHGHTTRPTNPDPTDPGTINPAVQGPAECCSSADANTCAGSACQMGGCASAYLVSRLFEFAVPGDLPQNFLYSSSSQTAPLLSVFRPPIA